jgi:hypothetical protein
VARPQPLGNDEVERLADRLARQILKNAFRARVPEADHAVPVGRDDGVGLRGEKGAREQLDIHRRPHFLNAPPLCMANAQVVEEFAVDSTAAYLPFPFL